MLRLLLIYAFVFDVGAVGFLFGFIPHVFFADEAAKMIGWPAGSPFQFEVGLHDGAWGILGFLCVFIGGGFWLATAIGWSFFMFGAAWGHIQQVLVEGNYAPYNFFPAHHRHAHPDLAAGAALRLLARRRPRRQAAPRDVTRKFRRGSAPGHCGTPLSGKKPPPLAIALGEDVDEVRILASQGLSPWGPGRHQSA